MKQTKKPTITTVQKKFLAAQLTRLYQCDPSAFEKQLERLAPRRRSSLSRLVHNSQHDLAEIQSELRGSRKLKAMGLAFGAVALVVVLQVAYPRDRALPFARLQAHGFIGLSTKDQIMTNYQDFDTRTLTVHTHGKTLTTSYADLGVRLQPNATLQNVSAYSTGKRLIPFSILFVGNKTFSLSRELDESQLELFAKDLIAQTSKQPKDAGIELSGTQLSVSPSEEGYEYKTAVLRSQILRSDLKNNAQIVFAPTVLPPAITTDTATTLARNMQQRIATPLLVQADDKALTVTPNQMASWLEIVARPDQNKYELSFNKVKVADTLRPLVGQVQINVTPTVITILNGTEAGRAFGTRGKVLKFNELVDKVAGTISPTIETVIAPLEYVEPKEIIDRRYSRDSFGLQTLIDYWTANHAGDYSIDVRTINGRINGSKNPYKISSSVGIYRIYIAHMVYSRITAKSLSGNTVTTNGQTVDACIDKMMRESDESCTSVLGALIGWGASDDLLRAQGFDNTTLAQNAALTTASNTTDWMIKLLNGGITTKSQADTLLSLMGRQSFRSGIPAGSPGIRVADKAGQYGRTRHDVGIVYHPSGTYAVSILSEGSSFAYIADLTREINKLMAQ